MGAVQSFRYERRQPMVYIDPEIDFTHKFRLDLFFSVYSPPDPHCSAETGCNLLCKWIYSLL